MCFCYYCIIIILLIEKIHSHDFIFVRSAGDDLVKFLDERTKYHGQTHSSVDIQVAFNKTFSHTDFKFSKEPGTNTYERRFYPTKSLFTRGMKGEESMKLFYDQWIANRKNQSSLRRSVDQTLFEKRVNKSIVTNVFIYTFFKRLWDLQADGDQTNATMTNASLERLVPWLCDKGIIRDKDVFLDIGSSYGSLLWYVSSLNSLL